jgi:hypothetical protein
MELRELTDKEKGIVQRKEKVLGRELGIQAVGYIELDHGITLRMVTGRSLPNLFTYGATKRSALDAPNPETGMKWSFKRALNNYARATQKDAGVW